MENQQNVCARCCKPLGTSQARWNQVFWGMAHRRCRADKVWPPKFRPSLDPNEILRQIHALSVHLGRLGALGKLADGLPIPQILPDSTRERTNPPPGFAGDAVEEKHDA